MLKLILLTAGVFAGFQAYRWVESSDSDYAKIARTLIWGEDRKRTRR